MSRVRLDHNATTPLRPEVRALLVERLDAEPGNPSSLHPSGRLARAWIDEARERVAAALGVAEEEVVFTSGGTESNNLALLGGVRAAGPGRGLASCASEHSSVLGPAEALAREGRPVRLAGVDREGRPDLDALLSHCRDGAVAWVSLAAANNELGTLGPLEALAERLAGLGPRAPELHTDAVQALGRVPVALDAWGVATASFSAHKLGGPPGVGVLVRRRGVALEPLCHGGGQEQGLRPGTESAAAISAAALALELAVREQPRERARLAELARELWEGVHAALPFVELLGPPLASDARLPNTLLLALGEIDGRVLVTRLALEGLEASAGSACASGALEPSHVLLALGLDRERARSGLRLSLGRTSTREDVHTAVDILRKTISPAR